MKRHVVIYSHGFGVRKDDRGMMTDIAAALPECEHVLFDYNSFDEATNTLTVAPLQAQVRKLKEKLEEVSKDPEVVIDLVAHSQGCIVAALAKPMNARKMLFITPPDNLDKDRLIQIFGSRPGSHIDIEGESRVPRRDGTTTVIPAAYWKSLVGPNVMQLYNRLPQRSKVTFIIANDDEILGRSNFDQTNQEIELYELDGDHDFTDEFRSTLIEKIQGEVNS